MTVSKEAEDCYGEFHGQLFTVIRNMTSYYMQRANEIVDHMARQYEDPADSLRRDFWLVMRGRLEGKTEDDILRELFMVRAGFETTHLRGIPGQSTRQPARDGRRTPAAGRDGVNNTLAPRRQKRKRCATKSRTRSELGRYMRPILNQLDGSAGPALTLVAKACLLIEDEAVRREVFDKLASALEEGDQWATDMIRGLAYPPEKLEVEWPGYMELPELTP